MNPRAMLAEILGRNATDGWCRREDCRYRHWQSGGVPTHRRGDHCPEGDHVPVTRDEIDLVTKALIAVLDIHGRCESHNGRLYCERCLETEGFKWPCLHVRTITEALKGES